MALVMRAQGRYDSARRYVDAALALKPHYIQALLVAGEMALQRNDVAAALEDFTIAVRAHPSNIDAKIGLGWALLISGQVEEAARAWRPVAGRTIDPTTLHRMIDVYTKLDDQPTRALVVAKLDSLETAGKASP